MKIGVLTALFGDQSLEKVLDNLAELGVEAVELGTGNFVGNAHCNPDILLENNTKLKEFGKTIEKRGIFILEGGSAFGEAGRNVVGIAGEASNRCTF